MSKAHAVVERIAEDWYVRDLDSRNGTWLNGDRVFGRAALTNNDRIKIGATVFVFGARDDRSTQQPSGQVRVSGPSSGEVEVDVARLREAAFEYLPADLVADSTTLARDYERLRLARLLTRHLGAEMRLDALLPGILDHLFTIFNGDRGAILLVSETGELVPRAVAARGLEPNGEPIQLSHALLSSAMESRSAVLSRDSRTDGPVTRPGEAQGNKRSSMCAPLIGRHNVALGVIHLESISVANAFSERDLGSFYALAEVAAVAIEDARHVARLEKEAAQRAELTRHVSGTTIERIVRGEVAVQYDAAERDITVLWLDIRDVVSTRDPEGANVFTHQLLQQLIDIMRSLDGTVERAGGDAVVAVWGAPVDLSHGPARAERCASAVGKAIHHYNANRVHGGFPPIRFGIGIACGLAIAGIPRWSRGGRFTVIGAPINTAAHLAKMAGDAETLATEAVRQTCPSAFLRSHHPAIAPDTLPWLRDPLVLWVAIGEPIGPRGPAERTTISGPDAQLHELGRRDTY